MWTDNETAQDFLNFGSVARTVAEVIEQAHSRPISIGVSGAWGVGKSSMIKLIRGELDARTNAAAEPDSHERGAESKFIFVEFNAWLYQGYDDARAGCPMIDFHAHLDLYPDPQSVVREISARGMYVLSVTTTPSAWKGTSALVQAGSRIRTALGLHPQLAHLRFGELDLFDEYLPQALYVGEIGLDGGPEYKKHWQAQLAVFDHMLGACKVAGGKILAIHSRRATSAVLDRLEAFQGAGTPILHWFSGSPRELQRAVALGCWFSVGPAMLAAEKARGLARAMPKERVLTETDGPFAQLDGASAKPWDAERATAGLADLWNMPHPDVDKLLHANLRGLITGCRERVQNLAQDS